MKVQRSYRVLLALVTVWCVFILVPPLLSLLEFQSTSKVIYAFFSRICHQDESRSFAFFGYPLAVCVRCSMIYVGFLAGTIVAGFRRKSGTFPFRLGFVVILLPMLLDVALDAVGLHHTTQLTRIVTGSIFGVGAGVLLTPLVLESAMYLKPTKLS